MRYRMLGIDLDGTLIEGDERISDEDLAAIRAAQAAGMEVVPCTGRSWRESRSILDQAGGLGWGVFISGAAVVDIVSGRSLETAAIEPVLVAELIELLKDHPEAVLVFRSREQAGHDYLVTGRGELTDNTRWWFEFTGVRVHEQPSVAADELGHCLRVGMVAPAERTRAAAGLILGQLGDRVRVNSFGAVQSPDAAEPVHVLEVFAAGVDKWRGLAWIAQRRGIGRDRIATIGDEVNDLPMLTAAGCGIAMANATDQVKEAADHVTARHDEHGVAHAIGRLLSSEWG